DAEATFGGADEQILSQAARRATVLTDGLAVGFPVVTLLAGHVDQTVTATTHLHAERAGPLGAVEARLHGAPLGATISARGVAVIAKLGHREGVVTAARLGDPHAGARHRDLTVTRAGET